MVSGSLSYPMGSEEGNRTAPLCTYTERFYQEFPYYLAMGMTPEQFWEGDPDLARYYRKAEEIRNEKRNQELWLQGMYIYEALCDASPIFNAFAKKGTKPRPYAEHPYSLTDRERKKEQEAKEQRMRDKAKRYMENIMLETNKRFRVQQTEQ